MCANANTPPQTAHKRVRKYTKCRRFVSMVTAIGEKSYKKYTAGNDPDQASVLRKYSVTEYWFVETLFVQLNKPKKTLLWVR